MSLSDLAETVRSPAETGRNVPGPRAAGGWACYEFARAPSATLMFMFIFAPYFTHVVVGDPVRGVELWGLANTVGGVAIACLAPLLGAAIDRAGRRMPMMTAVLLCLATTEALLWFAMPGTRGGLGIGTVIALVALLTFLIELSTMLHNAMLAAVATPARAGAVSGLGYAMSNAGSLLSILLMLALAVLPAQGRGGGLLPDSPIFGLNPGLHEHDRVAGPFAAVWLMVFSLPFLLLTPDLPSRGIGLGEALRQGARQLRDTLRAARSMANVGRFLVARMAYNDAIIALQAYSAILAVALFGWTPAHVLVFAVLLTAACLLGGLAAGRIDRRWGARRTIMATNALMGAALVVAISCSPHRALFVSIAPLTARVGVPLFDTVPQLVFVAAYMVLGAAGTIVLVSSRALLARITPLGMTTQFFGIYSLSGYATAFVGHSMVAGITGATGSQTWGVLSLLALVMAGQLLLTRVREERAPDV